MFKKKKKYVPPVAAVKLPPKVVKETKNYRLVQIQQPTSYFLGEKGGYTGVVSNYRNQLVLEKRNINSMEEPQWSFSLIINDGPVSNWDLCRFTMECFEEKV